MDYSKKITTELIEKILSKGVRDMPQNPAAQGFTERQIRSFYFLPEQDILFLLSDIDTELVLISGRFNSQNAEINRIERLTEVAQETADKNHSEIENIHSKIGTLHANAFVVVDSLPDPTADCLGKIYLVLSNAYADNNYYDEYIVVNTGSYKWEKIGNTSIGENIDLSDYVKNTDYATDTKPGIIMGGSGVNNAAYVNTDTGYGIGGMYTIFINSANEANIRARRAAKYGNGVGVIAPNNMDLALKIALTESTLTLTEEEKASACGWLGALEYVDKTTTKILNSVGLWVGEPVTFAEQVVEAYKLRQTANGLNGLIDGALTKVTKIQGKTVACKNLIPFPYKADGITKGAGYTETMYGVTFTVLEDGGIKAVGTASPEGIDNYVYFIIAKIYFGDENSSTALDHLSFTDCNYTANDKATFVAIEKGETVDKTLYPMVNYGSTPLPYQPYYTEFKNSFFKGIASTNKNWFNPQKFNVEGITDNYGVYSGTLTRFREVFGAQVGGLLGVLNINTQLTISLDARCYAGEFLVGIQYSDGTPTSYALPLKPNAEADTTFHKISLTSIKGKTIKTIFFTLNYAGTIDMKNVCIQVGENNTYIPYEESSFVIDNSQELSEWDYIQDEKLVKGTGVIEFNGSQSEGWGEYNSTETVARYWTDVIDSFGKDQTTVVSNHGFTGDYGQIKIGNTYVESGENKLVFCVDKNVFPTVEKWKEYLAQEYANGTPLKIAYELATPNDFATDILQENKYTVCVVGTETVIQGDTDNSDVGANPTITNTYAVEYGG